jgi:opacity protein-like surface antigen
MIRNTLIAAAAVLALMTGAAMAQTAQQKSAQHPVATWANAHDTDYGYNHYPQ